MIGPFCQRHHLTHSIGLPLPLSLILFLSFLHPSSDMSSSLKSFHSTILVLSTFPFLSSHIRVLQPFNIFSINFSFFIWNRDHKLLIEVTLFFMDIFTLLINFNMNDDYLLIIFPKFPNWDLMKIFLHSLIPSIQSKWYDLLHCNLECISSSVSYISFMYPFFLGRKERTLRIPHMNSKKTFDMFNDLSYS